MPLERHIVTFDGQVEVLATMDVGQMWDRMLGEYLGHWTQLERQGLSAAEMDAEMRAFMQGLSDKPLERLARQSAGVAYNQGRSAEILSAAEDRGVQFVVRSEILDINTCPTCENFANSPPVVEVGTPEYDQYMPPSYCDGGLQCRGFYVAVAGGGEA
jgi:hypothetical protein